MITFELTADDLTQFRFGYSPLIELSSAYRALHKMSCGVPSAPPYWLNKQWVAEAQQAIAGMEFPYLQAVCTLPHYIPDFLTPTPETTVRDIEEEFAWMQALDDETLRRFMCEAIEFSRNEPAPLFHSILMNPRHGIRIIIQECRMFWERTLAAHWPQMMTMLDNDILYRGRQLALEGSARMIRDLDPELTLFSSRIEYEASHKPQTDERVHLQGEGIRLVPSLFLNHVMWQANTTLKPMIIYHARGSGLWYRPEEPCPNSALETTLGEGRAHVLQTLLTPASPTEIAQQLQITAGAASQHLRKLGEAGLVESQRLGKRVYYRLSERGERLLALFG
jgi:DNA-binding transcriptional ArsR family regulator